MTMRVGLSIGVLLLLAAGRLAAQRQLTITPAAPRMGDSIVIAYDAASPDAVLKDAAEMVVNVDFCSSTDSTLPMRKYGTIWRAGFRLSDSTTRAFLLSVASGERTDANGGVGWKCCVHDSSGTPVQLAHVLLGWRFKKNVVNTVGILPNRDSMIALFEREIALYPLSPAAREGLWEDRLQQDSSAAGKASLRSEMLAEWRKPHGKLLYDLDFLRLLKRVGTAEEVAALRDSILLNTPDSYTALSLKLDDAEALADPVSRIRALRSIAEYTTRNRQFQDVAFRRLCTAYRKLRQYDSAAIVLDLLHAPNMIDYWQLASPMLDADVWFESGMSVAWRGLERCLGTDATGHLRFVNAIDDYFWWSTRLLGNQYLNALLKKGCEDEAFDFCKHAFQETRDSWPDIVEPYLRLLFKKKLYAEVLIRTREVLAGEETPQIVFSYVRHACLRMGSTTAAAADTLALWREQLRPRLAARARSTRGALPTFNHDVLVENQRTLKIAELHGRIAVLWHFSGTESELTMLREVGKRFGKHPDVVLYLLVPATRLPQEEQKDALARVSELISSSGVRVAVDADPVNTAQRCGSPDSYILDRKGRIAYSGMKYANSLQASVDMEEKLKVLLAD